MATTWGSIVGSYGRLGLDITTSSTNTETTVTIKVIFWSKYSVSDTNNTYYFNNNATSATTSYGSKSISHTVASGSGWSTSNRTTLKTFSYTYIRGTSDKTVYCAAKFANIDRVGGTMTVSASYTIPKLASYTVKYSSNGGSGAPSAQTKWYGMTLKLSATKPTATGYTFKGWSTSSSGGNVEYASGANYTANASVTLYAVWSRITYSVKYNANGGSGAPSTQTKIYGTALTLSSTKPTRSGYDFQGWATSASGSVAYKAGANYTTNAAVTLYAVWKSSYTPPTITNLKAIRCDSFGNVAEDSTYAKVTFSWSCNQNAGTNAISSIKIAWSSTSVTPSVSGTSGSVSQVIGSGSLDVDTSYKITVTVTDSKSGSTSKTVTLPTAKFMLDFKSGGTGVAFGKTAQADNRVEFGMDAKFANNRRIYGTSTSGTEIDILNLNTNDNTTLGHGGYSNNLGATNIYGNLVRIYSNTNLAITVPSQGISARNYGQNVLLWSGVRYPDKSQTLTLSQAISAQPTGAVFVFSYYSTDLVAQDYNWDFYFVPKRHVLDHSGKGITFANAYRGMFKYIYVSDTSVVGHSYNDQVSTINGIAFASDRYVLRYILGV